MNKQHVLPKILCVCVLFFSAGAIAQPDPEFVLPSGVRVQIVESHADTVDSNAAIELECCRKVEAVLSCMLP